MANILKPHPQVGGQMLRHWWQWLLLGLMIASTASGILYIVYSTVKRLIKYYKLKQKPDVVSSKVIQYLDTLALKFPPVSPSWPKSKKPSSFGVYMGHFSIPPTSAQAELLRRWDILILDPLRDGVRNAIECVEGRELVARLDLSLVVPKETTKEEAIRQTIDLIMRVVVGTPFTGILVAGWEVCLSPAYIKALAGFIEEICLLVYLEVAPPNFLEEASILHDPKIAGLVIRNASILPNGEKRDYFDMMPLQPTVRAFVAESCLRQFTVLAWEEINDDADSTNAIIKRGMQWCGFYSALTWVGSSSATMNAEMNFTCREPLGAFEWLKEDKVVKIHDTWKTNTSITSTKTTSAARGWKSIFRMIPETVSLLGSSQDPTTPQPEPVTELPLPSTLAQNGQKSNEQDPLSFSPNGQEYMGLGCFPLGADASPMAFAEVLQAQNRLKGLGLLHPVDSQKLTNLGVHIRRFHDQYLDTHPNHSCKLKTTVKELASLASNNILRVNLGLDPGFKKNSDIRFWAVYQNDYDGPEIFVSKNAQGLAGTVLHTFLSSRGFSRRQCFEVEYALAEWSGDTVPDNQLPRRLVQDIDLMTPEERLLFLQHLNSNQTNTALYSKIKELCRWQLLESPSQGMLKELHTVGYLNGTISPSTLLKARLAWYDELGCAHPRLEDACTFFADVDTQMTAMFRERREEDLNALTDSLGALMVKGRVDAWSDMLGLAVFCAARKGAFDEVYAEVTDRNPLFNDQSDQAAAFAESFALGSRCEAYFDVSPSVFGKLLSDKFRAYYEKKQPPIWINGAPEFATTYGGANIDVDPNEKVKPLPGFQRFTFLSVFAIPALVDIVLLSTIGRGLYLSSSMTLPEQESATTALMISLLLSGAIGTWIACGGSYYLISMAFSAMNVFVLSRFIAGMAFTIAGGLVGFAIMSGVKGIHSGIIFLMYLVGLTAYLTLFASVASFQFPGTSFLSGRKVIIFALPWLAVSPIVTTFAGHDAPIYIIVMYVFIGMLLLGLRHIGSKWVTWYQNIRKTDDSEVRNWYISNKADGDEKALEGMTDPAALKMAREALLQDVRAEVAKGIFSRATKDKVVLELSKDWEATNFLLDWYCRYSDVPRPIPFSSSWNIQVKVALQTLSDAQKGIRLHSAFIHWRQAGSEVGCGTLYFLIALLDKWIDMVTGGHLIGLSGPLTSQFRMATGFGLAYYLIGAVLIDTKAQSLHDAVNATEPEGIRSTKEIREHQKRQVRVRRKMYWKVLGKFFAWHVWSLAVTGTVIWIFETSVDGMIMFLAYVVAYTGLLWYQYTKIFSGPHALKPLLAAIGVGLPLGIALKKCFPNFYYSTVIALAVGTWTAAVLSLFTAKIGMPKFVKNPVNPERVFHAFTKPWADPEFSQQELETIFENLSAIPEDTRYSLTPGQHPGAEVIAILQQSRAGQTSSADPVTRAVLAWEKGDVSLELVPLSSLGSDIRAISRCENGQLTLVVGIGGGSFEAVDISTNCQIIAEYLVHAVAEALFKIPHEHSILAETVVSGGVPQNVIIMLAEEQDPHQVTAWAQKQMLKQQCLGLNVDTCWEKLPKALRQVLLRRCLGQPCTVPEKEFDEMTALLCSRTNEDLYSYVARCNLGVEITSHLLEQIKFRLGTRARIIGPPAPEKSKPATGKLEAIKKPLSVIYHAVGKTIKFFVIAMVADPEFQREFNYVMKDNHAAIRLPCTFLFNAIWTYARFTQNLGLSFFLFHGRTDVKKMWDETKGLTLTLKRNRVVIRSLDGTFTAFKHKEGKEGGFKLHQYKGIIKSEPKDNKQLTSISTYSKTMQLLAREEYKDGKVINEFKYDYRTPKKGMKLVKDQNRIPVGRRCVNGQRNLESVSYDSRGLVDSGSYLKDGNLVRFKLHYRKNARFGDQLLRAEFVLPHITATVSWCAPPKRHPEKSDRWIPHSKITEATFVHGADVYESRWLYDHKFDPSIFTTCNGQKVQTPPMIEHDYLEILKKPRHTNFVSDDPILHCNSLRSNPVLRALGLTIRRFPVSTSLARSQMWRAWKNGKTLDGVIVRWMDDKLLRKDSVLRPYWRNRNIGDLSNAKKYLDMRVDAIMASADLDDDISSWTPLAVKLNDLYNFGPGGDAIVHTRSKDVAHDTDKTLHVLAADNGTWPNEGGGVSACRRDMVNSLKTVKWHMLCESANDFGIPKHQTEQNVQSLKVVPLWGLDFLTPTHGLFKNRLDAEVDHLQSKASDLDIQRNFIPTLTALVKGARAVHLSPSDIKQATRALVNLNDYFQDSKHWGQVWTSDVTKESWRNLWLTQDLPNTKPSSQWLDTELPTLGHLDTALDLWFRYLFVFSIRVPDKISAVFQASHHSVSASYGIVCKIKRNCQLQIWDHAIAWRETNMCLSATLCKLPPFVRNSLLGLMRLTSVLVLHHADIILPCADFFNPGWEVEIGTSQGSIEHRNSFRRKIAPVVNGITDAAKFKPIDEIKTEKPTVTMLSHLWFCKDLKTAILAADIIVNEWGFKDYRLDVYGSIEKAPTYSVECQELLASKSLRGQVKLCGTADPLKVLEKTWLFLNSSLSEGLPLALGEAALTGAPVVCTDVGASLRVLSDPDDFSRYSGVVPPNDARALARAQIKMLGMLDEWSKFADDDGPAPTLTSSPTPEEVEAITRRMYEKSNHRRKLGMKTREIVQKSFSGDRYLREHEQMLWIGKCRKIIESRTSTTHFDPATDEKQTLAQAIQLLSNPIDDEVITIAPSLIQSWRSSAASNLTSAYASRYSTVPDSEQGLRPGGSPLADSRLSIMSTDTLEVDSAGGISVFKLPPARVNSPLPVFAPGGGSRSHSRTHSRSHSRQNSYSSNRKSGMHSRNSSYGHSPRPRSRAMSPAGRDLLRGLTRQEIDLRNAYRNSDVSIFDMEHFGIGSRPGSLAMNKNEANSVFYKTRTSMDASGNGSTTTVATLVTPKSNRRSSTYAPNGGAGINRPPSSLGSSRNSSFGAGDSTPFMNRYSGAPAGRRTPSPSPLREK